MTVNQLIRKLEGFSKEVREKQVVVIAENGMELEPHIKTKIIDRTNPLDHSATNTESIVIHY